MVNFTLINTLKNLTSFGTNFLKTKWIKKNPLLITKRTLRINTNEVINKRKTKTIMMMAGGITESLNSFE